MGETVSVLYNKTLVEVTPEVADFLEVSRKQMAASDKKYQHHNVPLVYCDPDTELDTQHCTGVNYLLNVVIRMHESEAVLEQIRRLPPEHQELYRLRYMEDLTQQEIANRLGVSKMAICKRLKKLHNWARFILAA